MIIFKRDLEPIIRKNLFKNKIIIIFGPRQSGKTTLTQTIIKDFSNDGEYFDCQTVEVRNAFVEGEPKKLKEFIGQKTIVVFDEAQTIQNIGRILKVFHDHYPEVQVIATGSSSFDLANKIIEPMTGRAIEYTLLPLSLSEIKKDIPITKDKLLEIMQFGSYPEIISAPTIDDKKNSIKNIATNYLYKDIFMLEQIRHPVVFEKLLKALAYQIGSLVSVDELAKMTQTSPATVNRYMRLLEQSFIIKIVRPFSNNPRTEITKAFKVYFFDVGIRNVLAGINEEMITRQDKDFIFENFFFCELLKKYSLEIFPPEIMFWRTRKQLEIDFIEKDGQFITATECKWTNQEVSFSQFLKKYPNSKTNVACPEFFIAK